MAAEVDERALPRRARRVVEARFPRLKRLEDFDLAAGPGINPATLAGLASGAWIDAGEPVVLLGDPGTGKSHLLIGMGVAACEAGRRVRYVTCASLVNELAEGRRPGAVQGGGPLRPLRLVTGRRASATSASIKDAELLFQV